MGQDSAAGGSRQYSAELEAAIAAARRAGEILRADFHRPEGPRGHGEHAEADRIAESLIHAALAREFPDYGYRGEELSEERRPPRDAGQHVWLVDPNDGTNSYLRGARGSSVSIALLRDGLPVLGVVYAFCAPDDAGDLIVWAEGNGPVSRNGRPVARQWPAGLEGSPTVLLSAGARRRPVGYTSVIHPMRFRAIPSIAYRLALVAAGEGDVAVSLHNPGDWDYGAGHALLLGAGADLFDTGGHRVAYTREGLSRCGGRCFGGPEALARELASRDWTAVHRLVPGFDGAALRHPEPGRAASDAGMLARAQGCLLGQVAGDALGAQVEFCSATEIRRRFPAGVRLLADGGTWNTLAGQPTDDSELALALARSIVREGRYSAVAAERAYRDWLASRPFDVGGTTRRALADSAEAPAAPDETSQANGALMRVSPLAVHGATLEDEEAVARAAMADARITHPHRVCRQANAVFALAVARAVRLGEPPEEVYRFAVKCAERLATGEEEGGGAEVRAALEAAAGDGGPRLDGDKQGWVLLAFENAFHQLLHAGSVEEGVVATVGGGGDTDTNAAICGALLGAVYGRQGVPAQWRDRVLSCRPLAEAGARRPRPQTYWPVDVLVLAEHLLTCAWS